MKQCVIFNPRAARGRAARRFRQLQAALGSQADFRPTQGPRHAVELAIQAAREGFRKVSAAGGDGTVHEVANGLLQADNRDVTFAVLPLGSANDYACSLGVTWENALVPEHQGDIRLVDVGWVRSEKGRECYFINTLGLGFSGGVALESRKIRWFQGLALYGMAFLRALLRHYACPTMTVAFDGHVRQAPTLSLTVAIGQREGSFVVAPKALLDDGWFDYLHAGALSRWEILRFMPRLASGGQLPVDHPAIWQGRCRAVELTAPTPLTVHLDGEFFSQAEDEVRSLTIRLLPNRLRVQVPKAAG